MKGKTGSVSGRKVALQKNLYCIVSLLPLLYTSSYCTKGQRIIVNVCTSYRYISVSLQNPGNKFIPAVQKLGEKVVDATVRLRHLHMMIK